MNKRQKKKLWKKNNTIFMVIPDDRFNKHRKKRRYKMFVQKSDMPEWNSIMHPKIFTNRLQYMSNFNPVIGMSLPTRKNIMMDNASDYVQLKMSRSNTTKSLKSIADEFKKLTLEPGVPVMNIAEDDDDQSIVYRHILIEPGPSIYQSGHENDGWITALREYYNPRMVESCDPEDTFIP